MVGSFFSPTTEDSGGKREAHIGLAHLNRAQAMLCYVVTGAGTTRVVSSSSTRLVCGANVASSHVNRVIVAIVIRA